MIKNIISLSLTFILILSIASFANAYEIPNSQPSHVLKNIAPSLGSNKSVDADEDGIIDIAEGVNNPYGYIRLSDYAYLGSYSEPSNQNTRWYLTQYMIWNNETDKWNSTGNPSDDRYKNIFYLSSRGLIYADLGDNDDGYGYMSNDDLVNNYTKFRVTQQGQVGVGVAVPSGQFDVRGKFIVDANGSTYIASNARPSFAIVEVNTSNDQSVHLMDNNNGGLLLGYKGSTIQARNATDGNDANLLLQYAGGNVGIGNNAPTAPLSFANGLGDKVHFYVSGSEQYGVGVAAGQLRLFNGLGATVIGTQNGTGVFTEKMRIGKDGKVGIGTADPYNELHVIGTANATRYCFTNGACMAAEEIGLWKRVPAGSGTGIFTENNVGIGTYNLLNPAGWDRMVDIAGTRHAKLSLKTETGNIEGSLMVHNNWLIGPAMYIGTRSDNPVAIIAKDTVGIVVSQNGNVGIGGASDVKFRVLSGEVRLPAAGGTSTTHFNYASNGYNYIRGTTIIADEGGNVGIGTKTPGAKLEVSGTIKSSSIESPLGSITDLTTNKVTTQDISSQKGSFGATLYINTPTQVINAGNGESLVGGVVLSGGNANVPGKLTVAGKDITAAPEIPSGTMCGWVQEWGGNGCPNHAWSAQVKCQGKNPLIDGCPDGWTMQRIADIKNDGALWSAPCAQRTYVCVKNPVDQNVCYNPASDCMPLNEQNSDWPTDGDWPG